MSKRTLLIIGGGIEALPGIRLAKAMGLRVVVSDGNASAPGMALADFQLLASTYDVESTVAAARQFHQTVRKIDGVMCIASDIPLTVATVAHALGLPGIPIAAAKLATDKLAMKIKFAADGVPVPWFSEVQSAKQLFELVARRDFPLVIKPVDSRGARGVLRLSPGVDLNWAFEFAKSESPTGRVILEQFLSGPQVSTESLVVGGVAHTPGFSDRNYEFMERYAPFIIENGGELPSFLSADIQKSIKELINAAAASMGIRNGIVKGDIVVHDGQPYVIELAARLSGGYFCTHEIPLNTGVDLVGAAIKVAIGEPVDPAELQPEFQRPVAQRYLFPEPGKVVSITGVDEVEKMPGMEMCEVRVKIGDVIGPVNCHPARAGVIIATGDTRREALARAVEAVETIKIRTEA
jgi:biotin carboxylase